ncbi:rhamnulokinase family protein [Paenibacillus solisilvae]|uniref:Rhamnulokinase family protein n=1 Tax=Paenibacillus solisilvae TaxID=2486751 RepID=A0ABW0W3R1_9BACL
MKLSTVLAFDLGASSGRALIGEMIAVEGEGLKLEVKEIHRFPNQAIHVGNHIHWDILRLFQEVKTGILKTYQEGYRANTLGIDSWGVDFGLLDESGELLGNPYHYRDQQTNGLVEELAEFIGVEELYLQSGLQNMPFNTIYQLFAMVKTGSPKLDAGRDLLMIPDLIAYMLTGRKTCEYTTATTTQLFHPVLKTWNKSLMETVGIPSRIFIEPFMPGDRIGPLAPEVCEELSVDPINVIAVATHDTASAIAAVPAGEDPFAYLVCGTWSLLGTELSEPLLSPQTIKWAYSNEGGAGNTFQLLKNIMGLWIVQECKREWEERGGTSDYPGLMRQARAAPAFQALIDPDDSQFYTPHGMVDKIRSYCRKTWQKEPVTEGEIIRCVLESLSLRYRHTLEQLEKLTGRSFSGLHLVGGGVQNGLLCQLTANAIGRQVWAGPVEASAIGNMLVQLIASGLCRDLNEARFLVKNSFPLMVYEAQGDLLQEEAYERFKKLIQKID